MDDQRQGSGMTSKSLVIAVALLVLIAGGAWWYATRPAVYAFEFAEGERISSWDFQGAYTGDPELEERGRSDVARLKSLFGEEGYTEYELYISLANQHALLGDGKGEYDYLMKALAIDSESTGLAWHNLGNLLERYGAYESAALAYDAMVDAQPITYYQTARLEFLRERMPEDAEAIQAAEAMLPGAAEELIIEDGN